MKRLILCLGAAIPILFVACGTSSQASAGQPATTSEPTAKPTAALPSPEPPTTAPSTPSSNTHTEEWVRKQLKPLQAAYLAAENNRDWGAVYDLFTGASCPKAAFIREATAKVKWQDLDDLLVSLLFLNNANMTVDQAETNDTKILWTLGTGEGVTPGSAVKTADGWRIDYDPCFQLLD